ncbi:hypothetical protein B1R94_02180 [Mycolicibacterium litorale]|nr:hypothetical protein B1R94_02180 [Mycolicibacterium litorale]
MQQPQLPPDVDTDALDAGIELIGRAGAKAFEIGYVNENVPVEEAGWYAHAQWGGHRIMADNRAGPVEAVEALARKVLNGSLCTHCGKPISLSGNREGICRWTRRGDSWVRGCVKEFAEHDRSQKRVRATLAREGAIPVDPALLGRPFTAKDRK